MILQDHLAYARLTETTSDSLSKRRAKKRAHAKAVLEVHHKRHDLLEQAKEEQHQRRIELAKQVTEERQQRYQELKSNLERIKPEE